MSMNETIKQFLDRASKAYYSGSPIISDAVFDQLSDTYGYTKVGATVGTDVETNKHLYPLFSLQKYYEDEDKAKPLADYTDVVCTPKLDGAAVSLLYIDGDLAKATTRGDGVVGQDVTRKFLATKMVPHSVDTKLKVFQVDGELVAPINIENARNYAAGALNLKSVEEFAQRALSFIAYSVRHTTQQTYRQDLQWLASAGFGVISEDNLDKIFPCDGVVFRVNSNKLFDELGYTSKHPRGAYAKKQRGEHVETTLLAVEWQVGKTGKVTPVAILDPVYIGDALVSRATLNNPGFIEMLGIEIGDRVAIIRAGEIIPCITHKVEP